MRLSERLAASDGRGHARPEAGPSHVEIAQQRGDPPVEPNGGPADTSRSGSSPAATPASTAPSNPPVAGWRLAPATKPAAATRTTPSAPGIVAKDALTKLKDSTAEALYKRMGTRLNDASLDEEQLHAMVRGELNNVVEAEKIPLSTEQRQRLIRDVEADVLGHGPLQRLLDDPMVTEIMVNGPSRVYVEKRGRLERIEPLRLREHLAGIERVVAPLGLRLDQASPLVDARLADGSRVDAVMPPLAPDGPCLTIRRFRPGSLVDA